MFRRLLEGLRLSWNGLSSTRLRRMCAAVVLCLACVLLFLRRDIGEVGYYVKWQPTAMFRRASNMGRHFVYGRDQEIYMYSAIATNQYPVKGAINIIVTTLDASSASLQCCVLVDNKKLYITSAQKYFFHHKVGVPIIAETMEYFQSEIYYARQYACSVPEVGRFASHVTLTSSVCSPDIKDYLPVHYPAQVPGGLGICAKIAYTGGRDPEKVIEWFEVQRILGVDKVVMYDMGNPDELDRVYKYYQRLGILDILPYELPGLKSNRTLFNGGGLQHSNDETMAVMECRQRLAGYSYVLSHDMDEFLIPRRDIGLKEFFKEKMEIYQDSAGFYFDTEFFIYNWGPSNPDDDLMLTRYRRATVPHDECTKHVHLPSRTLSIDTHHLHPFPPFSTYRLGSDEVVLHHYRVCPKNVWETCFPPTIIDDVMTRYKDLRQRVLEVRNATNTKPDWTIGKQH